jgi:hypothetical protein
MAHMLNKGDYLSVLLRSAQSVFSTREIALLWRESAGATFRKRISYYVKNKKLHAVRRGIYAKGEKYEPLELAVKIMSPSYVSFETVLGKSGVVFQSYKKIFLASYQTRDIKINGQIYSFKKVKNEILLNPVGIRNDASYSIATPERAFLDALYLNKNYHFDNLSPLDQGKVFELLPVYQNKRMSRSVEKLFREFNREKS